MSEPSNAGGRPHQRKVNINVRDEHRLGVYANCLAVSHSPHEFTLDFCQFIPGGDADRVQAEVVSRVKIPPTMVGKVIRALNTNMTAYEDKFGMVKEIG